MLYKNSRVQISLCVWLLMVSCFRAHFETSTPSDCKDLKVKGTPKRLITPPSQISLHFTLQLAISKMLAINKFQIFFF